MTPKQKFEVCKSCEFLRHNSTCKKCNCFMPLKVRLPLMKCPIDKW